VPKMWKSVERLVPLLLLLEKIKDSLFLLPVDEKAVILDIRSLIFLRTSPLYVGCLIYALITQVLLTVKTYQAHCLLQEP
jgi:hypothetical protein